MTGIRNIKTSDIETVAGNLWQRGRDEFEKVNSNTINSLHALRAKSGDKAWAIYHQDHPVAVFGAYYNAESDCYYTWFAASEEVTKIGLRVTRLLRNFINEIKGRHSQSGLEVWSAVEHVAADRWFECLGFIKQKPLQDVGLKVSWYTYKS